MTTTQSRRKFLKASAAVATTSLIVGNAHASGVRAVLEPCRVAQRRNLSIVSGLCLRHDNGFKDPVQRIHDYALGDIVAMQANDLRGPIWRRERTPDMSEMTWQMRNWYYYT